jgi:hypothetical protein
MVRRQLLWRRTHASPAYLISAIWARSRGLGHFVNVITHDSALTTYRFNMDSTEPRMPANVVAMCLREEQNANTVLSALNTYGGPISEWSFPPHGERQL